VTDALFDEPLPRETSAAAGVRKTGLVSGRTYTRTRGRGFAPWRPQRASVVIIEQVHEILETYRDHLPMTARQIFYVMVGTMGYAKTELAYDNLGEKLNRARRAGLIPMDAIRDDGQKIEHAGGFNGVDHFWDVVRGAANDYRRDLAVGQPRNVELWCEAAGMVPMLKNIAHPYGVDVLSASGFDSVTNKYDAALRMSRVGVSTDVLHIGDHDPSGLSIVDAAAEDITAFVADLAPDLAPPLFVRLAVTEEQIERYGLQTAPQKDKDKRGEHMGATVQAEALSPDQLAAEVRAGLESVVDLNILAEVRAVAYSERREILAVLDELPGTADG
jgi:hypothetical protein